MSYFFELNDHQKWDFVAMRVRCALHPEQPEMVDQFVQVGGLMVRYGKLDPWETAETTARVLVSTATDSELPEHWRERCRANLPDQLARLEEVALSPRQILLARELRRRAELLAH
ncbi:hypothetical protein [Derxia gummosa]|uniref:Uncharacterized protein n=1 Tax=Derxia gummosa DSM 723 TaxID=1121388 RepID=A0A8B6X569_9BURK|nr:hypothetical protein [Derxia gummosa]